jgi:hypothetical protein
MTTLTEKTLDTITEKIKKILRLAESGNANESEVAMMKAKKLAEEHDINLSLINSWEVKEKEVFDKTTVDTGNASRLPVTHNYVSWILTNHFKIRLIMSGSRAGGRVISIIGLQQDADLANYLYGYLSNTFMSLWHTYKKKDGISVRDRSSYLYGLYEGLNQKLRESTVAARNAIFGDIKEKSGEDVMDIAKDNYQVAIVGAKKKLDDATAEFFPRLRKSGGYYAGGHKSDSIAAGRSDGARISLNRGVTSSTSRQIGN